MNSDLLLALSLAAAKIVLAIAAGLTFLVGLGLDYTDVNDWVG